MSYSRPLGNFLSTIKKIADNPLEVINLSVDAAAGGPQQRRRAREATARGADMTAQADAERAQAAATAQAATTAAAAQVAQIEAAAAASKKKLIRNAAIGGGAFVVIGLAFWFITSPSKKAVP